MNVRVLKMFTVMSVAVRVTETGISAHAIFSHMPFEGPF